MTDNKSDKKLNGWTDYFIDGMPWFFGIMFALWLLIGILPFILSGWSAPISGQIGDTFGMANSLFSGFAFAVAMLALVMQIRETRESGERHAEESRLANENIQRQLKQDELQTRQMELAERTAAIQEATMKDATRQRQEALLIEILEVSGTLNTKIMMYRCRIGEFIREPMEHVQEKRNAALSEVLIVNARMVALRGAVIIRFLGHDSPLRDILNEWLRLPAALRPQENGSLMSSEDYHKQAGDLMQRTTDAVGVLHKKMIDGVV